MQIYSAHPIVVRAPGREIDIEVRVTAPAIGTALPVLLLSHGHGPSNYVSSLHGYAPLVNVYAAHGFVVIQPTHLDSKTLPYRASTHPDAPLFWKSRAQDMTRVLDELPAIEAAVPWLAGRVARDQVVLVGHSMGGHTASMLLGARCEGVSLAEPRILAGVLLGAPGRGDALSARAAESYAFFTSIDFSTMTTPALVVAGDNDASPHLTTAGPSWHADPYHLAPGPKSLLWVPGAEHGFGGISMYDAKETTDESPARVAFVARMTTAYLQGQLGRPTWDAAVAGVGGDGRVESKA